MRSSFEAFEEEIRPLALLVQNEPKRQERKGPRRGKLAWPVVPAALVPAWACACHAEHSPTRP